MLFVEQTKERNWRSRAIPLCALLYPHHFESPKSLWIESSVFHTNLVYRERKRTFSSSPSLFACSTMIEQSNFPFNPLLQKTDESTPESYSTPTPPATTANGQMSANATQTAQSSTTQPAALSANYAMAQQLGQANYGGEYGSMYHRSSYIHSHAKPPYSYISLIAMSIQVISCQS